MIYLKNPEGNDYAEMYRLAGEIDGIVQHAEHVYKIMCDHFGQSIFIARKSIGSGNDPMVGLMLGFVSRRMDGLLFVWQIGVHPSGQGKGTGSQLMQKTISYARSSGCKKVMATVETDNYQSQHLFEKAGFVIATKKYRYGDYEIKTVNKKQAIKNYYGSGTDQIFYEYRI